jgi:hypothetical protein
MPKLQRLLRRKPPVAEPDPELQARVQARLASITGRAPQPAEDKSLPEADAAEATAARAPEATAAPAPEATAPTNASDMADATGQVEQVERPAARAEIPVAASAESTVAAPQPVDISSWSTQSAPPPAQVPGPPPAQMPGPRAVPAPLRAPKPVHGVTTESRARRPRSLPAGVYCPYCASLLQPPPTATRRCPRCRQRIVVRRVGDRTIYLTEAAVPVFQAERRKVSHSGRWTRDRDRWLDLARSVGAPADRVERLATEPITEGAAALAKSLYESTVERQVRSARRDRRWEEAARIRFDQAVAVYRLASSAVLLREEAVRFHREGLGASLRGIAEVARTAELKAGTCCDLCRADDGRVVRIADELRAPSLPHATCPKGLCRCRWFLADRDRAIFESLLKQQGRARRRSA